MREATWKGAHASSRRPGNCCATQLTTTAMKWGWSAVSILRASSAGSPISRTWRVSEPPSNSTSAASYRPCAAGTSPCWRPPPTMRGSAASAMRRRRSNCSTTRAPAYAAVVSRRQARAQRGAVRQRQARCPGRDRRQPAHRKALLVRRHQAARSGLFVSERGATKQREQEFSEKGTLVRDQRWNAGGDPVSDESFYLNGQPLSKAVYGVDGDPRLIEITEFHDNGQRAAVGRYVSTDRFRKQNAIGTHQRFSEAAPSSPSRSTTTRAASPANAPGMPVASSSAMTRSSRTAHARPTRSRPRPAAAPESSLIPAALMIGPQRFDSSRDSAANCWGVPGIASMPKSLKRFIPQAC